MKYFPVQFTISPNYEVLQALFHFISPIIIIFLLLPICCSEDNSQQNREFQNEVSIGNLIQGYGKSLSGETIRYGSPQPDVNEALLVRSLNSKDYISWETAGIPQNVHDDFVRFVWIFGMDVDAFPHNYELLINGEKWFSFSNPENSSLKRWRIEGREDSSLDFRVTMVDRNDDVFGYVTMKIPAPDFPREKPLVLKVIGENAGSRVWYMTF